MQLRWSFLAPVSFNIFLIGHSLRFISPSVDVSKSGLIEGISHLTQLFELFVIRSYPSAMCSNNVDEVEQSTEGLRSSLSEVTLKLDIDRCTKDVSILNQSWLNQF